ncbi:cyclic nucleotide-binding domain protein (macronuclear) [Tetrahymena thermophila SB210]|uniref:Cyclic nucleotide-binding domain protein n=1 Tax=Tetrahymena thermophila (strain SB210) TaxID=312017 RepID=W7X5B0_TETTS|nr:cyclic nucleotide-binding domain protein [Tetrahymena thermophila SB210]EWS74550.1 cyclic nucleotide-binding domain protein [Tetrahymena thermophila SB210]|eukprot:XP_012652924.1 cyclic nucleotide-binding domain protein [Tetrahymena thermophila SB210]
MIQKQINFSNLEKFLNSQLESHQYILIQNQSENQLGDEGALSLGSGLGKCTNVSILKLLLEKNQISDRIEQKYSHIYMHSEQILIYVIVQQVLYKGNYCRSTHINNHKTKNLTQNQIGAIGASGLGSGLGKSTALSKAIISLNENQIGDDDASGLCSGLGKCTKLSNLELRLDTNKISAIGASYLGSGIAKCTNISNLKLNVISNDFNKSQLKVKCLKSKGLVTLEINW